MQKRLECTVFGRVQFVMFRDFAQRKGTSCGVVGTVRNLPDGSVSVIAEGEEDRLQKFLALLHRGSILSRVERVEESWGDTTGEFTRFTILYT